jgi:hypothetical protein
MRKTAAGRNLITAIISLNFSALNFALLAARILSKVAVQ